MGFQPVFPKRPRRGLCRAGRRRRDGARSSPPWRPLRWGLQRVFLAEALVSNPDILLARRAPLEPRPEARNRPAASRQRRGPQAWRDRAADSPQHQPSPTAPRQGDVRSERQGGHGEAQRGPDIREPHRALWRPGRSPARPPRQRRNHRCRRAPR